MIDWLSEIEEFNKRAREICELELGEEYDENSPMERMARVLRELAEGTNLLHEAVVKEMCNDIVDDVVYEYLNNLSDDAKELCVAARDR